MISFEVDIKPLFRELDRDEMKWAFDLWIYEEVKANAESIIEHVFARTMPCDEPWAANNIDKLVAWYEAGMPP